MKTIKLENLLRGCKLELSKSITLAESTLSVDQIYINSLIKNGLEIKKDIKSLRIGLTGSPGCGKSSFVESFGCFLLDQKKIDNVAVLAIDPSSPNSGGSILGDKVRMSRLAVKSNAFIRPSPSKCQLGGILKSTFNSIQICELANFSTVIVETVGAGQSEYNLSNVVDIFILLVSPTCGDEIQGIKRGIIEKADIILITKSDGDLKSLAWQTKSEYMSAIKILRNKFENWKTPILEVSSKFNSGFEEVWKEITRFHSLLNSKPNITFRNDQKNTLLFEEITFQFSELLKTNPTLKDEIQLLNRMIMNNHLTPFEAANIFIKKLSFIK